MTEMKSAGCCATCCHYQRADDWDRRVEAEAGGWCWWLTAHQGMVAEVPIWMSRAGLIEGRTRRVPMGRDQGSDCYQWQARLRTTEFVE